MAIFEKVSKYADADIAMPIRKTAQSAGYDMVAAEDYIIPSLWLMTMEAAGVWPVEPDEFVTTDLMAKFTKQTGFKPTLVSTGMKCKLDPGTYLELSVRSSCPLKYWLVLANSVGIIDADYYNNPGNEGHIWVKLTYPQQASININPFVIKKGEAMFQGIIQPYFTVEDDDTTEERVGGFGSTSK